MCAIYMWRNQYLVPKQGKRYVFTDSCTLNITIKCDQIPVYIPQVGGNLKQSTDMDNVPAACTVLRNKV